MSLSSIPQLPHVRFFFWPTVLDKCGVNGVPSPWDSLVNKAVANSDVLALVTTIEYHYNKRHLIEVSATRSNANRTFCCLGCQTFQVVFRRPVKSKVSHPWFLKEAPHNHEDHCAVNNAVPSRLVLVNLPLYVSLA